MIENKGARTNIYMQRNKIKTEPDTLPEQHLNKQLNQAANSTEVKEQHNWNQND